MLSWRRVCDVMICRLGMHQKRERVIDYSVQPCSDKTTESELGPLSLSAGFAFAPALSPKPRFVCIGRNMYEEDPGRHTAVCKSGKLYSAAPIPHQFHLSVRVSFSCTYI